MQKRAIFHTSPYKMSVHPDKVVLKGRRVYGKREKKEDGPKRNSGSPGVSRLFSAGLWRMMGGPQPFLGGAAGKSPRRPRLAIAHPASAVLRWA
jgi:hypothetical protein